MKARRAVAASAAVLLAASAVVFARTAYLEVKALVAGRLIERAFERYLSDGAEHPPWNWADMHPLARLDVERLGVRRYVLAGATGSSLAFGLGHLDGSSLPGGPGGCVVAGHRDSWAGFLRDLRPGDEIAMRTREGMRRWVVRRSVVTRSIDDQAAGPGAPDRLLLVTCWPFDAWGPTPMRYVVACVPAGPADTIPLASRPSACAASSSTRPSRASPPSPLSEARRPPVPPTGRKPVWF